MRAAHKGRLALEGVPGVRGEFLLKGATGFARRDWGTALANLWIVVEQLTTHLWYSKISIQLANLQLYRVVSII